MSTILPLTKATVRLHSVEVVAVINTEGVCKTMGLICINIPLQINNVCMINIIKMEGSLKVVSYNSRGFPKIPDKLWEKPEPTSEGGQHGWAVAQPSDP